MKTPVLLFIVLATSLAHAQSSTTLYKSVGSDGKITYSDQPPPQTHTAKTLTFASPPTSPLSAETRAYMEQLQKSANARAAAPAPSGNPVLFSAVWCGYCTQAKAYLARKQIAYREVDIDTKDGLIAYARAGGGKGVPLLEANGKSMAGFSAASYDAFLGTPKK